MRFARNVLHSANRRCLEEKLRPNAVRNMSTELVAAWSSSKVQFVQRIVLCLTINSIDMLAAMRAAISLRQLEVFLAVARHGQVTRAARSLHLTQSAASMALRQLERLLDASLFHRLRGKLLLTERGRLLLTEAPDLVERVGALPELLSGRGRQLRGELRIASSTTIGRHLIAPMLGRFSNLHPLVRITLSIGNATVAARALKSYEADVAYVEGSIADAPLEVWPWRKDQMQIIVSAAKWRRRSRTLRREQLGSLDWVMREPGSGTREILEQALAAISLPLPTERLRLEDSEAILSAVASGFGVACLSSLVVDESVRAGRLVVLRAPWLKLERTLWCAVRRGARAGPLQQAFIDFASGR